MNERGQALIEAVFALGLFFLVLGFQIQLVQLGQSYVVLQHGAFLHVRSMAWGESPAGARARVLRFTKEALSVRVAEKLVHAGAITFKVRPRVYESVLHIRMQGLWPVSEGMAKNFGKFRVSRACSLSVL